MKPIKIIEKLNEGETVFKVCPFCGKESTLELTDDESSRYNQYKNDTSITIQDALPNLNPSERECLISGLCSSCQKEMFDSTYESDRITEGVETKAGNDMDEICSYVYSNYLADDRDFPSREEFEYIADVTANEYKKIKYLCTKAYDKVKDHLYDGYIELNDNDTLNQVHSENKTIEEYQALVDSKLVEFENETGVEIWQSGRMGRHIVVENNYNNASQYEELQAVQERLEQEVIDEFNGEEDDEIKESAAPTGLYILSDCKDYEILKDALDDETLYKLEKALQHYVKYLEEYYMNPDNDIENYTRDIEDYTRKYGNGYVIDWYEGLMSTDEFIKELKDGYSVDITNELEESSDWDYNTAESWRCDYPEPHYKDEDEDEEDEEENDYPQEEYDRERAVFGDEE